jgi:hypothetical protein
MQAETVCTRYQKYLAENASTSETYDFQNAVFRYLVSALGGPCPSAKKRAKLSDQDIEAGLSFLAKINARELPRVLEALTPIVKANNTSQAQQERGRRNLRTLHSRRLQP